MPIFVPFVKSTGPRGCFHIVKIMCASILFKFSQEYFDSQIHQKFSPVSSFTRDKSCSLVLC